MRVRSRGRALALQALYSMALHSEETDDSLAEKVNWILDEEENDQQALQFAFLIIRGVLSNLVQLNDVIHAHTHHWHLSRLLEVDKAILRLSVYSLLHLTDIPVAVTINEAVELAKQYSDEHSSRFINGVLDSCAKNTD